MPTWLDTTAYPFSPHYFDLPMGRMHYVDEGPADADHAIVMVHGNPGWSFSFREMITHFAGRYRCVAPDHIGFGLSDKPPAWDYLPEHHAQNLEQLLNHLDLPSITLVVGDWGGPLGLSYALKYPDKVKSLVITNTWLWPVKGTFHYEAFSRFMGGAVGRFLIQRYNFFVKVLMKQMFRAELPPTTHRQYIEPLSQPEERKGCWVFPREIIGSTPWLETLWAQRAKIADKPTLLVWGLRDIAFRDIEMAQWQDLLTAVEVHAYDNVGHFVQEELGQELCALMDTHLEKTLDHA